MSPNKQKLVMHAFQRATLRSSKQLEALGIYRADIQTAQRERRIERVARGLYRKADAEVTENHSLVLAMQIVPKGVVCLLSALRYHVLTTQAPHVVWIAVPRGVWRPKMSSLRIVQYANNTLKSGMESHLIEGVQVRVTTPARTVADCFKFKNRVGLDVALEALREARRMKRCTIDEILTQARLCRVDNVIRPYLEAMS
jgi:predicted transcriptional regulator of viral defense system